MFARVVLVLALAAAVQAQVMFFGRCPNVSVMNNFNPTQYLGKWYEAERYFTFFQLGGKCVTATYSSLPNNSIGVYNKQINRYTGVSTSIEGVATRRGNATDGRLLVKFPSSLISFPAPYWVLDTDYTNYAVVYACNSLEIVNLKFVWILTRAKVPTLATMNLAYEVLRKNKITRAFLLRTDQARCPATN